MVAMSTSLSCRVSAMFAFCRLTTQNPHKQSLSRYLSHKASYRNFTPKIVDHDNVPQTLDLGYVVIEQLDPENLPHRIKQRSYIDYLPPPMPQRNNRSQPQVVGFPQCLVWISQSSLRLFQISRFPSHYRMMSLKVSTLGSQNGENWGFLSSNFRGHI